MGREEVERARRPHTFRELSLAHKDKERQRQLRGTEDPGTRPAHLGLGTPAICQRAAPFRIISFFDIVQLAVCLSHLLALRALSHLQQFSNGLMTGHRAQGQEREG